MSADDAASNGDSRPVDKRPFTQRQRRRMCQTYGNRPTNNWGEGDLPAPWCEGDIVRLVGEPSDRLYGQRGPFFVVTYATSVDEGDAWYFRAHDHTDGRSDRLHVAFADRAEEGWEHDFDFMSCFELVDTPDPEGLARRDRMLAEGWSFERRPRCEACGQELPRSLAGDQV